MFSNRRVDLETLHLVFFWDIDRRYCYLSSSPPVIKAPVNRPIIMNWHRLGLRSVYAGIAFRPYENGGTSFISDAIGSIRASSFLQHGHSLLAPHVEGRCGNFCEVGCQVDVKSITSGQSKVQSAFCFLFASLKIDELLD